MRLTRSTVIMTNATVIIGLIILITFQSLTSPFISDEVRFYFTLLAENEIELDQNYFLFQRCSEHEISPLFDTEQKNQMFQSDCNELEIRDLEVLSKGEALVKWGQDFGYLDENGGESYFIQVMQGAPVILNSINFLMIFPFVISSAIEAVRSLRDKTDVDFASKAGIITMIAGFIGLLVGLGFIILFFIAFAVPMPLEFSPLTDVNNL